MNQCVETGVSSHAGFDRLLSHITRFMDIYGKKMKTTYAASAFTKTGSDTPWQQSCLTYCSTSSSAEKFTRQ